ncbi:MAG: PSD1 and planctomycete cytochrome C domain-containing protein [Pirellulales bacterium]|nr:PSD1 and planctomycete cytochrome C domain-containing protein [Pirellulales bacterium]
MCDAKLQSLVKPFKLEEAWAVSACVVPAIAKSKGELMVKGLGTFCSLVISVLFVGQVTADDPVDFSLQIQPILAGRCFACHGPDEKSRKSGLRLDQREAAIAMAIQPGNGAASALVKRVRSADPEQRMPPVGSQKPALSDEEISLLERWIEQGAKYERHWSLEVPRREAVPQVSDGNWCRNPVDRFVYARLKDAELVPSPEGDRRTLARRLSFDLTGLPPSSQEVEAFVANDASTAYEDYVDHLLDSPHFGERMAIYWLDVVRYADTMGIHSDNFRPHFPFRDWVIKAFNDNLPYDQFVREQVAGDLLPGATSGQLIASGFNRLNMTTEEGGAQSKEYRAIYQADRVRNFSVIFLGMTLGCAQCHDHKFDPFTTRDFYSLAAFFSDVAEVAVGRQVVVTLPKIRHNKQDELLAEEIAEYKEQLDVETPELATAQRAWESSLEPPAIEWTVLDPNTTSSQHGAYHCDADGILEREYSSNPTRETTQIVARVTTPRVTAVCLELLTDRLAPLHGPGRSADGSVVIREITLSVGGKNVPLARAEATAQQEDKPADLVIDGKDDTAWLGAPKTAESQHLIVELQKPIESTDPEGVLLTVSVSGGSERAIPGRMRLWVTGAPLPLGIDESLVMAPFHRIVKIPEAERSAPQKKVLSEFFRQRTPLLVGPRKRLEELLAKRGELEARGTTLVTISEKPRMVRILPRGNWMDESGEVVTPAIPGVFGELSGQSDQLTRLDLARWVTSKDHPLTARVYVNRLWKLMFGSGLVRTLDDFGTQGRPPSHPELLDWLAAEFVDKGWDTKYLIRLLVTSATYRQSSVVPPALLARDPENEFLARQNRFRLEAEMVRDNALAVSGLLVRTIGGASVKPYQPVGYWENLQFPKRKWEHDEDGNQYRRGLYTFWCRTFLHPALLAFDAPTREECTVERPRSNTPLAALVLLNDPTYVEAARVFAQRILNQPGTVESRLSFAFREVLQREPSQAERDVLNGMLAEFYDQYSADPAAAAQIQTVGSAPAVGESAAVGHAAWTAVARTLLNLHETITRN